jgi:MULE transposase domain
MIALAVSNKEDEEMFYCLLKAVKDSFQMLDRNPTFTCTMADNSDPIQRALHRCFPSAVIGNCSFHLQQNIKNGVHFRTLKSLKTFRSMSHPRAELAHLTSKLKCSRIDETVYVRGL